MRLFSILVLIFPVIAQTQVLSNSSELSVELGSAQSLPLINRISFEVMSSNARNIEMNLANWEGIIVEEVTNDSLIVTMPPEPRFLGEVREKDIKQSFVVDFEEASVKTFVSEFKESVSKPWDLKKIEAYVGTYIDNPTYVHGFNIASVITNNRSGDCTEYAVLVTALARSLGIPARIVLGTVLIEGNEQVSAFGHAWAEVFIGQQWQILDAALYTSEALRHFYLPSGELKNEGPGFSLSVYSTILLNPQKINKLRSVKEG